MLRLRLMADMHVNFPVFFNSWRRLEGDTKTLAQLASIVWQAVNLPGVKHLKVWGSSLEAHGSLCRYLRKARLMVIGRWDATKNSLFPLLNKWALGCDFTAATSDRTHALIRSVGRTALWACARSSSYVYGCVGLSFLARVWHLHVLQARS